jgi:hypothetical protein
MRAPTQGDPYIREWRILDQALPVPFPLSAGALADPAWIPINDSLSEDFAAIRRFANVGRIMTVATSTRRRRSRTAA